MGDQPAVSNEAAIANQHGSLSVALVGAGSWGARLLQGILRQPSLSLRCVCDRDIDRLAAVPASSTLTLTSEWHEVLASPDIEAVVIAVAPEDNGDLALEALRAGKHVLVEKPFATSKSLGRRIAREAEERGLVAGVGHILRYHPAFKVMDELLKAGDVGAPWGFLAERLGPHRRRELSPWWVLAPHDLSLALGWLGQGAHDVRVIGGSPLDACLRFEGGATGRLFLGEQVERRRCTALFTERAIVRVDEARPETGVQVHFLGARQSAVVEQLRDVLLDAPPDELRRVIERWLQELPAISVPVPSGDALQAELAAFAAAVRRGTPLATSVAASLPVLDMLVLGHQSQRPTSATSVREEELRRGTLLETHGAP